MWNLTTLQPGEIIDIAVQIEEQGSDFYQKLAQRAKSHKTQEVLLNLAAEEKKHIADFKEFGKDLEALNPRESYPGEYFDYLKSTVETHLFHDLERLARLLDTINSEDDVLRLAINFEKDSILFFFGFRMFVEQKKQAVIDRLIEEEKEHLSKLNAIKKQLEVEKSE